VWYVIEICFLTVFTIELGLNLFGFGKIFWEDWWNWIDTFIIVVSLVDFVISTAAKSAHETTHALGVAFDDRS